MTDQFGIKEALNILGVKEHNPGTSTGSKWYENGSSTLTSSSPADGAIIGTVTISTGQHWSLPVYRCV